MTAHGLLSILQFNGYNYLQRDDGVGALYALKNKTDEEGLCIEPDILNTSFEFLNETNKLYSIDYLLGNHEVSNNIRDGLKEFGYTMVHSTNMAELWKCDNDEFMIFKILG